jgi:hypothetical protein
MQTRLAHTSLHAKLAEQLMKHATWWQLSSVASLAKWCSQAVEQKAPTRQFLELFVALVA